MLKTIAIDAVLFAVAFAAVSFAFRALIGFEVSPIVGIVGAMMYIAFDLSRAQRNR